MRAALVRQADNIVTNVIEINALNDITPDQGIVVVAANDDAEKGATYNAQAGTFTRPERPRTLLQLKVRAFNGAKSRAEAHITAGYLYNGNRYDANAEAEQRLQFILLGLALGQGLPGGAPSINWWDKNNTPHSMDATEMQAFVLGMRDWIMAVRQRLRDIKDELQAITTLQDLKNWLQAGNLDQGWPA